MGAHRAGLQAILVKTGKHYSSHVWQHKPLNVTVRVVPPGAYAKGDEKHLDGKEHTFVAENFAHAAEMILNAMK